MTAFTRKKHLFSLTPCPVATPTVIGVLRTSPEQYISGEATLVMRGAGLANCYAAFQNFDAITGVTPGAIVTTVTSAADGAMDIGLGSSMLIQVGGAGGYDLSFEITSPNETATTALLLHTLETGSTTRVYPAGPPGGLEVRRLLADCLPTAWTTMGSVPVAAGKVVAIRARVHSNYDLGGGGYLAGAATWYIFAKNDSGTVTILGDTRNSADPFYDYSYNVVGGFMDIQATAGSNAVNLQCNGSGACTYSLFVDSALVL